MSRIYCDLLSQRKFTIILIVFLIGLLEAAKHGQRNPTIAGPYRAIISKIGNISDDYQPNGKIWMILNTTKVHGKEPQYGWGHSYAAEPITDDMKVQVRMAIRSNNQWKKNWFVLNFDKACSTFRFQAESVLSLFYGVDFKCPLPVIGLREIKNQTIEFVFPKFPVMPYGRYLATFAFTCGKVVCGLIVADVEVVRKI